ncbi:cholecystokinin receptor type A-like [Saccostrea cucullata]|uniref:cholecystokinin receptor type A-like n=1 Tax=Saccostrea cuccullata TaxID=36930 RepID=UPI002ED48CF1
MMMDNGTFDVEAWNEDYARRYTVSTIVMVLYLILGIIGNLLVLIVYSTKMHSKHDDRYFIPFLASVDLSGCIISTSLILIENNLPYKYPDSATCKFLNVSACGLIISSMFLLLVISIQRYQKICRPFGFQMNLSCKRIVAFGALLLASAFAFPTIFLYQTVEVDHPTKNITGIRCGPVPNTETFGEVYRGIVITAEVISVICMSVLYALVGYTLVKKMKPKPKSNHPIVPTSTQLSKAEKSKEESETYDSFTESQTIEKIGVKPSRRSVKNKKTKGLSGKQYSLMFMMISLVSCLCFFPPWILVLLETKDKTFWNHLSYKEAQVLIIVRGLFVVNFVVNPFIYGFFDSKFRHKVWKCLSFCRIEGNVNCVRPKVK